MFGLFESKAAKFIREDTKRTISNADVLFDEKRQKDIAKKVLDKIPIYDASYLFHYMLKIQKNKYLK